MMAGFSLLAIAISNSICATLTSYAYYIVLLVPPDQKSIGWPTRVYAGVDPLRRLQTQRLWGRIPTIPHYHQSRDRGVVKVGFPRLAMSSRNDDIGGIRRKRAVLKLVEPKIGRASCRERV